jgi:hypothetical protein
MPFTINVKAPKTGRELDINLDFGESLDESVAKYGKEVVHNGFVRMCKTDAGNKARAMMNDAAVTLESIKEAIESWVPGVSMVGGVKRDPVKALIAKIESGEATDEELEEAQAKLREAIKARKAKANA